MIEQWSLKMEYSYLFKTVISFPLIIYSEVRFLDNAYVLSHFCHVWLCKPMNCSPQVSFVHGDSPGKNTGVDCHAILQGNLLDLGIKPMSLMSPALTFRSLWLVPPGKPRPYGSSMLNYFRNHQTVSKKVLSVYIPTNNGQGFPFLPT